MSDRASTDVPRPGNAGPLYKEGLLACAAVLALSLAACQSRPSGPYDPPSEETRDTTRAEQLSREAADLIYKDPKKAEELLRSALTADLFFGPAHNNLGVLFLEQQKLYEASHEFEWARRLMPGNPDPRVNLALAWERAGHMDEALEAYDTALEVVPDYLPAVQGIACLTLRTGKEDARLSGWLKDIALRGESHDWRNWAQRELSRE